MKKITVFLLLASLGLVGCRTFPPVHNIEHQAVAVNDQQKVGKAIIAGATQRGWEAEQIQPGLIQATLNRRSHQVVVEIPYRADFYSILYKDSENLRYDNKKGTIHPRYNTWIIYLNRSISAELAN